MTSIPGWEGGYIDRGQGVGVEGGVGCGGGWRCAPNLACVQWTACSPATLAPYIACKINAL